MELLPAIDLVINQIETQERHPDYDRTIELAAKYKAMITGENVAAQLIQVVQREDAEMFAQRVRLTKSITPAVAASVRRPYNKVTRNDRIKKKISLKNETREKNVQKMIESFFGPKRKKGKGLEYWLNTRFMELQFSDPNAWIVLEWKAPETQSEIIYPRPFEVTSEKAVNFMVVNDEIIWLLVKQPIIYYSKKVGEDKIANDGFRYTLYDEDITVVFEQVDPAYFQSINPEAKKEDFVEIGADIFYMQNFDPNLGFAPLVRIGYNRDEVTDGRTFVNPWHAGLCFFEKMLITVSEMDLTSALHTFPQKIQYVQKCKGFEAKPCNRGWLKDGRVCGSCKGTGFTIHTSAQDAIYLPMPDTKDDMINLDGLIAYKSPPIDLIKWQNEYILQLERQVHQAVFNSQVFVKNHYSGDQQAPDIENTATMADYNMESVYDTLEPYTEKVSEVWIDFVTMNSVLAGETDLEKIELLYAFPADFKLKTLGLLMAERRTAKESGAPPFLLETIDDDLAGITFVGDEMSIAKYKVRRKYFPFAGKSEEEIASLVSSPVVRKYDKVLYSNFEQIFKELEAENLGFYVMTNPKAQKELVDKKVAEFIETIAADEPALELDAFKPDAGTGEDDPIEDEPVNE